MPKRALLIVNRKSRSGTSDLNAVTERLKRSGMDVLPWALDRPEQIPEMIRRHAADVDLAVVGGGDGSLNAAAPALIETRLPLGVLPMGTANDLARTLQIPVDIDQASDIIAGGLLHRIDLGRVNDRYFFNAAHIGLGVHAREHLSTDVKRRWGVFGYARSLFKALSSFRPFHADIVCDGRRKRVRSIQISVGNGRHYGGGMTIAEEASIDDRLFFLYSIEPRSIWELVRYAPAFRAGKFEDYHPVDIERGRSIRITTSRTMRISADGEAVSHTPAIFEMIAGAVTVYVPPAYLESRKEEIHVAQG
ncbi:lipid kinase [Noviherbaspirillum sp. ST9]|uniref:lipid kinase n=1 Tax=Noviherbaspirillum sp. ST9 TaxID=3401606 RepID=UPI003B587212